MERRIQKKQKIVKVILLRFLNIAENEGLVIGNKIQYSLYEHLGERVKGRFIAKTFYLFPDRDVLWYNDAVREAEAALLRSNSPRNKRTNGDDRQNQKRLAILL